MAVKKIRKKGVSVATSKVKYAGTSFSDFGWVFSIALITVSFAFSLLFAGIGLTGNAIGEVSSSRLNVIGVAFFLIGILGTYNLVKNKR